MYRTQSGILALTYLAGAFGVAFYDMVVRANWDAGSLIATGAAWPLRVLGLA